MFILAQIRFYDADYIYNTILSRYSTIFCGEGNDTIENAASDAILYAEDGDYVITSKYSSVTINAGKGDDTISLSSYYSYNVIQYFESDGNDTIYGYNAQDTIQIGSSSYSTVQSGNDVVINVGSGTMTLINAGNKMLNISDLQLDDILQNPNELSFSYDLAEGIETYKDSYSNIAADSLKTNSKEQLLVLAS